MGPDAEYERGVLERAGVGVAVATSRSQSDWLDLARDADAVITRHADLDARAIAAMRRCRVIARYGTGVDNVDTRAAAARDIVVTYVPGGSTDEVADHAMGLILLAARGLFEMAVSMRDGGWVPAAPGAPRRLRGMRLGLVGGGRIGNALAERARSFGMTVAVHDPALTAAPQWGTLAGSLDELLAGADVVSLHVPLTPHTRNLIAAAEIERMPAGAILVNTARGGVLDLDAATEALTSGHLRALALDTFPEEPLRGDHPLRRCPNAILTPHMAYQSVESLAHAKESVVSEVLAVLGGTAPAHPWRDAAA